jgi:hypothetical protein
MIQDLVSSLLSSLHPPLSSLLPPLSSLLSLGFSPEFYEAYIYSQVRSHEKLSRVAAGEPCHDIGLGQEKTDRINTAR